MKQLAVFMSEMSSHSLNWFIQNTGLQVAVFTNVSLHWFV